VPMSNATPPPTPPHFQSAKMEMGDDDALIFNKWETGQFILSIWTRADGVVEEVEIRLRPSSPFAGRCRCGHGTRGNLERAILADAEMVSVVEQAVP